ncbi:hypothetical protein, partial [Treponema sp. R6D11]
MMLSERSANNAIAPNKNRINEITIFFFAFIIFSPCGLSRRFIYKKQVMFRAEYPCIFPIYECKNVFKLLFRER